MSFVAPSLHGRVSRRDVALSPHVWFALWATFALFALSTAVLAFVMPGISQDRVLGLAAVLAVVAIGLARTRPPEPGSAATHVVLALVYLGPAGSIWAFAPDGAAVVASAAFIGPLISVWLVDRRQIVAHLIAASVVLFLPTVLGATDTATLFATIALVPAVWVLAACSVLVMEAAETQGQKLERLVGRDPLTGLGNRRTLDEQLTHELARHGVTRRPLSVLALDLDGFKRLNDTLGHAAGDDLLEQVARRLDFAARRHDTVIRQGGDEFLLLMPAANAAKATQRGQMVREALQRIDGFGSGVTCGIGIATYPDDAPTATELLHVADERLRSDKRTHARRSASPLTLATELAARPVVEHTDHHRDADAPPESPFDDHVTRRELSLNRSVWQLTGAMILIFALIGVALLAVAPELTGPAFPAAVAFGSAIGIFVLLTPPPAVGTIASHASMAMAYVIPAAALVTCQPGGSVAIGSSIFVGGLTAMRATDRRVITAHLGAATVLFAATIPLGLVDAATTVAVLLLIQTMWVLGACCTLVFEAIEAQGRELDDLVRRDPLTGVGNRRRLHELLAEELPAHASQGRELTVLALDLNGFKQLNDEIGHAAGDDLLVTVADRVSAAAGRHATVIRQGGDEFCVLLPDTGRAAAWPTIEAVRAAVGTIDVQGMTVTTGIGAASFPIHATDAASLLCHADDELRLDKYDTYDLRAPLRA